MKHFGLLFLLLGIMGCNFHPLYNTKTYQHVCVQSIPEESGFVMYQTLKHYFPDNEACNYTLQVNAPSIALSDQGISDSDFTTIQRITATSHYALLNKDKKIILQKSISEYGSSAVVLNPYSTVTAVDDVKHNLYILLADQIAMNVASFLDKENK